jgi:hypothetical protein
MCAEIDSILHLRFLLNRPDFNDFLCINSPTKLILLLEMKILENTNLDANKNTL